MIELAKGKKHPQDKIVFVNGHQITFEELAWVLVVFCQNEEVIYPKPKYQGADYFKRFLNECMDNLDVSQEIMDKYKLPKKIHGLPIKKIKN